MNEYPMSGHEELWIGALPTDQGPEGNVKLWEDAENVMDGLCQMAQSPSFGNEGVYCALVDAYNRCREERRRAEELLALHRRWDSRPVGSGDEPGPIGEVPPSTVPGLNSVLTDAADRLTNLGPKRLGGEEAYYEAARKIAEAGRIVCKRA